MTFDRRLNDDRVDRYDEMERKMSGPVEQVRWEWDGKNFIRHTEIIEPPKPAKPDFKTYEYKRVSSLVYNFYSELNKLGSLGWKMISFFEPVSDSRTYTAVFMREYIKS